MLTLHQKAILKAYLDANDSTAFNALIESNGPDRAAEATRDWPTIVINNPKFAIINYYLALIAEYIHSLISDIVALATEVAGFAVNNTTHAVTVPWKTTVAGLKAAIAATDASTQTYVITASNDAVKEPTAELASTDTLNVTSASTDANQDYTISISPSTSTAIASETEGVVIDNEAFTITVPAATTAAGIIAALASTDESTQTYTVASALEVAKTGTDALVSTDVVTVTAASTEDTQAYVITVSA